MEAVGGACCPGEEGATKTAARAARRALLPKYLGNFSIRSSSARPRLKPNADYHSNLIKRIMTTAADPITA